MFHSLAASTLIILGVLLASCSSDAPENTTDASDTHMLAPEVLDGSGDSESRVDGPPVYALSPTPYTTLQAVWMPKEPPEATRKAIEEGTLDVHDLDAFEEAGLGVTLAAGNPWIERAELAPGYADASVGERKSLVYLWQSADSQIIDEESPIRFEGFPITYRPHGHLVTQTFEAHVRTAARIHEASERGFDFAIFAGDLTDGSQLNEFQWFFTALNGGVIDPDSGIDDDPIPGPGNDYNDPFVSHGLPVPWYAAVGNHDSLYNGGFGRITDELREGAVKGEVYESNIFPNGFRDGSTVNGDVVTEGATPPDEARVPQRIGEVLQLIHEAGGEPHGHGLNAEDVAAERGYFSVYPITGKPIRLITLQTVNPNGGLAVGSMGYMDETQLTWLKDELSAADAAHELVIVMSHHKVSSFANSSPISGEEVSKVLSESEGVVLNVTGHGHYNAAGPFALESESDPQYGYWELMLASTVDYPMQTRIIEIVDDDNGYLSIYVTNLDHNSPTHSLAHKGRSLAAGEVSFSSYHNGGDVIAYWEEDVQAQNLLLRIHIPDAVRAELAKHDWPTRIESEETLLPFSPPAQTDR
jgi:3',5'-cyclic AMP phosphodiesterase CpdA